jgi:hypothetical protein
VKTNLEARPNEWDAKQRQCKAIIRDAEGTPTIATILDQLEEFFISYNKSRSKKFKVPKRAEELIDAGIRKFPEEQAMRPQVGDLRHGGNCATIGPTGTKRAPAPASARLVYLIPGSCWNVCGSRLRGLAMRDSQRRQISFFSLWLDLRPRLSWSLNASVRIRA